MAGQPETREAPWTVSRLLDWTTAWFADRRVDEPRLSAEVLLAHARSCRRIELYTHFDAVPDPETVTRFRDLVRRAAAQEPIAYLVGEKEFYSLAFHVTRDVLIPRPETETLVERAIDAGRTLGNSSPTFLDLGTGSGCIAVAVLKHWKEARGVASDASPAALDVARRNAERHRVTDRLALVQADRLELPAEGLPDGGFDMLLSNPPYVPADEVPTLATNVRDYEPHAALTDHADGLSFYRDLAARGPSILRIGGIVLVEVGAGKAAAVVKLMTDAGIFRHDRTFKDARQGLERVLQFSLASKPPG